MERWMDEGLSSLQLIVRRVMYRFLSIFGHSAFPASHFAITAIIFLWWLAEELPQGRDSIACIWYYIVLQKTILFNKRHLTDSLAAGPIGLLLSIID